MNITVVFDNYPYQENLKTGWGFACLIEGMRKTILFDTGGDGNILLANMEKLEIKPTSIDIVFLSHEHSDHTGGLTALLNRNPNTTVYFPESFSTGFLKGRGKYNTKSVQVSKPIEICQDVWSTGELGTWLKEQSLVLKTAAGLVVITGCAHPGIVDILRKAREVFPTKDGASKEDIYLVMGGFHLGGWLDTELKSIISNFKTLGVKKAAPSHCSGDRALELFEQEYGKDFIKLGVGSQIEIEYEKHL